jgi:hypothetical protein
LPEQVLSWRRLVSQAPMLIQVHDLDFGLELYGYWGLSSEALLLPARASGKYCDLCGVSGRSPALTEHSCCPQARLVSRRC